MTEADLIVSLGPNCANSWNLRSYFGFERAYPFDWWITPARSMIRMIEPGFRFEVRASHLCLTETSEHNTVYNHKLNILHHHDFERNWEGERPGIIHEIRDRELSEINAKYTFLFERLHADLANALAPVAVLNGVFFGFGENFKGYRTNPVLNGPVSVEEIVESVHDRLGKRIRLLFVSVGEEGVEEYSWGWNISMPDLGTRENVPDAEFAEPIHVYRAAYQKIGLCLKGRDSLPSANSLLYGTLPRYSREFKPLRHLWQRLFGR